MNIDLYDLNVVAATVAASEAENSRQPNESSSSSSSTDNAVPTSSLNEEVTQMFSQLGRFWGGVRKQSQTVLESARKDLGGVVSQAQKELEKTFNPSAPTPAPMPVPVPEPAPSDETIATEGEEEETVSESESATGNTQPESNFNSNLNSNPTTPTASASASTSTSTSTSFFSRLQSSLPPNITPSSLSSTFQRHLPLENLQHSFNLEKASADFAQLRATLVDNIQRVQSETAVPIQQQAEKLAEQYLQKGEAFFKEAGEFLKDAVKVIPPDDGASSGGGGGVMWDGTDAWSIPATMMVPRTPPHQPTPPSPPSSRKGKEKEDTTPSASLRSLGRRREVLLRKLHSSVDEIGKNPDEESDAAVRVMWIAFIKEVEDNGTIQSKAWKDKIEAVTQRDDDEDTRALLCVHKQLVPSELSDDAFWTRYFFRIAQIQREEERRKALLEGTNRPNEDPDDGFTWEDEEDGGDGEGEGEGEGDGDGEDEQNKKDSANKSRGSTEGPTIGSEITSSVPTLVPKPASRSGSTTHTPSISPRRSEDSYDVVSSIVSSTGQKSPETKREEAAADEGEDSDWE